MHVLQERYSKLDWGGEPSATVDEARKRAIIDFARLQGVPEEKLGELERVVSMTVSAEDFARMTGNLIRRSILESQRKAPERKPRKTQTNGGLPLYETAIVSEDQLLPYLSEGWDILTQLASRKIILRRLNDFDE